MPSSYLQYSIDFDGDGRCDIWGDDPWDALASTAAYLASSGWMWGQPWGLEVSLDKANQFDFEQCGPGKTKNFSEWAELGISAITSGEIPDHGLASILIPAGANGPAFMVFNNFRALLRYNGAVPYGLAVGLLADRIGGGSPIMTGWPRKDRQLNRQERQEIQGQLTREGFDTIGIDGLFGPNTYAALKSWQLAAGLIADGYPTFEILELLRR